MDMSEGSVPSAGGVNTGRIASMQYHNNTGSGGAEGGGLEFGVDSNIISAFGQDPKGPTIASILTGGLNSVSGIAFDFGPCSATQSISGGFGLPTGPNVGLPNINFGLNKGSGHGR